MLPTIVMISTIVAYAVDAFYYCVIMTTFIPNACIQIYHYMAGGENLKPVILIE